MVAWIRTQDRNDPGDFIEYTSTRTWLIILLASSFMGFKVFQEQKSEDLTNPDFGKRCCSISQRSAVRQGLAVERNTSFKGQCRGHVICWSRGRAPKLETSMTLAATLTTLATTPTLPDASNTLKGYKKGQFYCKRNEESTSVQQAPAIADTFVCTATIWRPLEHCPGQGMALWRQR